MKSNDLFLVALVFFRVSAGAAHVASQEIETLPGAIVEQGRDYEIRKSARPDGREGSYVVVGGGLNYFDGFKWSRSDARLEKIGDGSWALQKAPLKIRIKPENKEGLVELTTPEGFKHQVQPLHISYFDTATDRQIIIAEFRHTSSVQQHENGISFVDAFEGATADVRFKVGPVIFEQDTILRNLPPPEQFNMDRNSTLVRVTTEFIFDPKLPDTKSKFHETTPQTEDEVMSIGDLDFVQGKAFSEAFSTEYGFKADNAHSRVVRKQWLKSSGNDLLEESIPFVEIEKLSPNVTGNTIDNTGSSTRESSQNGFVIDYVVVSGSSFIFRQGVTYYVQTSGYFGGQVTFEGGSIIKMNNSSSLLMYGPVSCQGGATTVITSKYDDSVGETIPGVTGTPQRFSGPALWSYYISGAYTFDNFHIKNGTVGAQFDYNASPYLYPVLKNITFESCGTAIIANRCTVDANNVIFCTVDRLTQTFNSGSVGLANTSTDCDGVIAFRSLPANTILSGYKELPLKVVTGHEKALGISLFIEDYGMADGAEVHQTNGQWVVKWETYLDYNGTRSIFLQMDRGFEEGSGKVSSSVPIQIKNLITVDPLDVPFVSQVNMIGYTTEPYDSYKLEVFSPNRTLLFTIYGSLVDIEEGYKQFSYIWICKARQTAAIMFPIPPSSLM